MFIYPKYQRKVLYGQALSNDEERRLLEACRRSSQPVLYPAVETAKSRLTNEQAVTRLLARLPAMDHKSLQQLWRELFGREPSRDMRRNHRIPILAYRAQEKAFGGLKDSTIRMLRELALGIASEAQAAYRPKTGTRYVREHNGKLHQVTVLDDACEYEGQNYRSLSEVATAITGTMWSGPAL